ncbi:MAG: hypothetical protein WD403_07495 [Pirellulales bacterium]
MADPLDAPGAVEAFFLLIRAEANVPGLGVEVLDAMALEDSQNRMDSRQIARWKVLRPTLAPFGKLRWSIRGRLVDVCFAE